MILLSIVHLPLFLVAAASGDQITGVARAARSGTDESTTTMHANWVPYCHAVIRGQWNRRPKHGSLKITWACTAQQWRCMCSARQTSVWLWLYGSGRMGGCGQTCSYPRSSHSFYQTIQRPHSIYIIKSCVSTTFLLKLICSLFLFCLSTCVRPLEEEERGEHAGIGPIMDKYDWIISL